MDLPSASGKCWCALLVDGRQVLYGTWLAARCAVGALAIAVMPVLPAAASDISTPETDAGELMGRPPSWRHTPDIDVFPQTFGMTQDHRGVVYVGHTEGLLEFDGERWTLIPIDNGDIVRSLAVDGEGRVLVGGYNRFGMLERDAEGGSRFVDLSAPFREELQGREFADIWTVEVAQEGVYFRALRDVFFIDLARGQRLHWYHEGRFGKLLHHRGRTLLQFRGEGFRRREGDAWIPMAETAALDTLVFDLLPLPDASLLSRGSDGRWWRLFEDRVVPAQMPEGMPASSLFEHGIDLGDGSLALAASDGRVFIVDGTLSKALHFQLDSGFLSGVSRAHEGGFLVASSDAIHRVAWPSAWRAVGADHGLRGDLAQAVAWDGRLLLMTSAGVQALDPATGSVLSAATEPWMEGAAHDLIPIGERSALLARNHHLVLVDEDRQRLLTEELVYPREFLPSRQRSGRIYLATEHGLRWVDPEAGGWRLSPADPEAFGLRVQGPIELEDGSVWFGSQRHAAWRIRFDASGEPVERQRFGPDEGLDLGAIAQASLALLDTGYLVAATAVGLFRFDGERFVADDVSGLADLRLPGERLRLLRTPDGSWWAYGIRRVLQRAPGQHWVEHDLRSLVDGALQMHGIDAAGRLRLVATRSLLLHDPTPASVDGEPFRVLLRSVVQQFPDGSRRALPLDSSEPPTLVQGDYAIQFQFALPGTGDSRANAYRGRLLGYEEPFSDWSRVRGYQYSRLRPGSYSLEVSARDGRGRLSAIEPYRLHILPPWHARWWAWVLWAALGAASLATLVQLAIRRRTQRLKADKLRLERMVDARTQELALANARLATMAHVDGLTGIANRRRLDDYLAESWAGLRQSGEPLAVLAIDVDHFKAYNDRHGHLAGDRLLRELVATLQQGLRGSDDLLARSGGEEFLAVLPGARLSDACAVAERMRERVEQAGLGATVSIGVASQNNHGHAIEALLQQADQRLYEAKAAGRNRVEPRGG